MRAPWRNRWRVTSSWLEPYDFRRRKDADRRARAMEDVVLDMHRTAMAKCDLSAEARQTLAYNARTMLDSITVERIP